MLAEMVRVIRPGGRVAIAVRAADVPKWVNLELPPEVAVKAGARAGSGRAEAGCSDASLYPRMRAVGLCELKMGPQLAITHPVPGISSWQAFWEAGQLRGLDDEETQVWRAVAARATAEGTYMWADPFHCAVGTKREH